MEMNDVKPEAREAPTLSRCDLELLSCHGAQLVSFGCGICGFGRIFGVDYESKNRTTPLPSRLADGAVPHGSSWHRHGHGQG